MWNASTRRRLAISVGAALIMTAGPSAALDDAHDGDERVVALLDAVIPTVVAVHTHRDLSAAAPGEKTGNAPPRIERAEGSGFVVSADGFLATNKHVVHGAYHVTVSMHDGRVLPAHIVWESSVVDVAFLKVEAGHPLPAARLARDDKPKVGRRVVAVGNPLGLGISASAGIVSANNRNLQQSPYDNYVQTDAAINNGNSGGPLFDLDGAVVGMNSILWTIGKDQGSQGLGFAIPAADISFLIDQLRRNGSIRCGTIGLKGQKLTAMMAEAFGYPRYAGVITASVEPGSTAERAGLRPGDIIETFDGRELGDSTALNRATCQSLGHRAPIAFWREGTRKEIALQVTDASDDATTATTAVAPRFADADDLGMSAVPIDDALRSRFHIPHGERGLVVATVVDGSEADNASLRAGDLIRQIGTTDVDGTTPFNALFATLGKGGGHRHLSLLVRTDGVDRWVTLPVRMSDPS